MNQENNTPIPTDHMQALLGAALRLPVIQCHKNDAPHKGELKEMSITEVHGFLNWVGEFFDLYVQDAENGGPVRICSCRYVDPNAQCEIYYLPLRKQRSEATPQVNKDSPAVAYVMHGATLIQHPGSEEWQTIAATAAGGALPFGEGELVLQKSPACTQKFRQPARWCPIKLPDICKLTFERHCTLHLVVGNDKSEQFSLLVRGNSVPPPKTEPAPNKRRKTLHRRTKRRKKKSKALPHVPLSLKPKPIVYKPNWESTKEWLYELFENHYSIACLIEDHLNDKEYPELAKLVNFTPRQY